MTYVPVRPNRHDPLCSRALGGAEIDLGCSRCVALQMRLEELRPHTTTPRPPSSSIPLADFRAITLDPPPIPVPQPRRTRRPRHVRGILGGIAALALTVGCLQALGPIEGGYGCPSGSAFDTSVMDDFCATPSGRVVCDLRATGFTNSPADVGPTTALSASGPDGPWCPRTRP